MYLFKHLRLWLMLAAILSSLFTLSACKNTADVNDYGQLTIELTDAEGDFSNYSVDVLSITLTKADSSIVEVLPETTRIDFAQYVEMSELLSSTEVPSGIYTAATLTLDYRNAEIFVENADGDNIQVSSVVDENNETINTLKSKVVLNEQNQLRIAPGVPAHISIDFDLKTSNVVSFEDPEAPVVTVSPVLNASLEPDSEKSHRVRGPLKKVNIEDSSFDLIIRPFHHHIRAPQDSNTITDRREKFGNLRVTINDETNFEINTKNMTGTDGLRAMNTLDKFTAVIAFGEISLNPRRFQASEVYVGSSVPGGDLDVVKGSVLSRTNNTLVVKGATLIRSGGSVIVNDEVTVVLDTTTRVKKQHDNNDYDIGAISVGQRVTVFGELNDDTANLTLDASAGMVRLLITPLSGTVIEEKDPDNNLFLTLDLNQINGRRVTLFNFEGTGIDNANDANPDAYEVETTTLDLSPFTLDSNINIRGFVNNFGAAPADFIAKSISAKKHLGKARMHTNWKPATNTAFRLISPERITLDFTEAGRFHHVGGGQRRIDLVDQNTDFSLLPNKENAGRYVIQTRNGPRFHSTFENLSNDLNDLMANGSLVGRIKAAGIYDINTGDFAANKITIKMQ